MAHVTVVYIVVGDELERRGSTNPSTTYSYKYAENLEKKIAQNV